jgi:hypothetical protein
MIGDGWGNVGGVGLRSMPMWKRTKATCKGGN